MVDWNGDGSINLMEFEKCALDKNANLFFTAMIKELNQ